MSSEWIQTTIGNQVQLQRGIDITKRDFRDGLIPVVSSGGVGGFHDTPTGTAPGVILGRKGIVGSVYYLPTDYWAHDTTLWVKDFKGNLPRYVYYFFKSITETLKDLDVGSANPTLNRNHVHPIETIWAPLSDQKAIAHILGALDDKIELNRKTNETLEEMAKALFKSWFVDFDPVRAKAEGRPTGLPDQISDLFPDSFEDSELGEIPIGWEVAPLGEVLDVDKGVSYKGDFLSDSEGLPMVNLGCFAGGGSFRQEKMKFYAGEHRERHVAQAGDLLIANTDMTQNRIILGAPIIIPPWKGNQKFLFSHHAFAVRFKQKIDALKWYVYFTLLKPSFRQVAAGHATGTTVLALPKDGITDYQAVIPPSYLLKEFAKRADELFLKCQKADEHNDLLACLRDALLPKLISGEIRIPDAERMLEEVGV